MNVIELKLLFVIVLSLAAIIWMIFKKPKGQGDIMKNKRDFCPCCGERITWIQKWRFCNIIGMRKPAPCPHCGEQLIWSKIPFRLMSIGSFMLICFLLPIFLEIDAYGILWVIFCVSLLMAHIGIYKLKLEVFGLDKKNTSQEKVR